MLSSPSSPHMARTTNLLLLLLLPTRADYLRCRSSECHRFPAPSMLWTASRAMAVAAHLPPSLESLQRGRTAVVAHRPSPDLSWPHRPAEGLHWPDSSARIQQPRTLPS
uniref:Putative secreted protein n=1 Tax=Anopheles triannulatus TaxID=58253 RepID=A0A2M4B1C1_9DIPT